MGVGPKDLAGFLCQQKFWTQKALGIIAGISQMSTAAFKQCLICRKPCSSDTVVVLQIPSESKCLGNLTCGSSCQVDTQVLWVAHVACLPRVCGCYSEEK